MILRAIPLEFHNQGGITLPKDPEFHQLAVKFADRELAEQPNYSEYSKVWCACEVDQKDQPVEIHGVLGFSMRPDVSLIRTLNRKALVTLYNRANACFADAGMRGGEVFVRVNVEEPDECKCPQQAESIKAFNLQPSYRFLIKVR